MKIVTSLSRRIFLKISTGLICSAYLPGISIAKSTPILKRTIPSSGQQIPMIGMGSWLTFDVGSDPGLLAQRVRVLQTFFDLGGGLIDSSPMYGASEETIGYCLNKIQHDQSLFSATKVWTWGKQSGITQMKASLDLWNVSSFDLMQIHNLRDWDIHYQTLKEWKSIGKIRHIGITTSHGRRHDELIKLMSEHSFDFVQFTYNMIDREAEQYLLPLAHERGIAVIINRPFQRAHLFDYVEGEKLPKWAAEINCQNWAQFFLKFIISHPAVTCAIPATSRVDHMKQNMGAMTGELPDSKMRKKMIEHFTKII